MFPVSAARPSLALGLSVVAASGVVLLASAASAAALSAPTVSTTTVAAGERFTISGSGCIDPVQGAPLPGVAVYSTQLGDGGQVPASGSWSLTTSFGDGTAPGTYSVRAVCRLSGGNQPYPAVSVTVAGPGAPPPPAAPTNQAPAPRPPVATKAPRPVTTAPVTAVSTTPTTPVTATATTTASAATTLAPAPGCPDCAKFDNDEPLRAGQPLTLRYTGFQPGEEVTLVMHSTPVTLGTFTADPTGVVTASFTLPASAEAGGHTLTFTGPASGDREVPFQLAARQTGTTAAPAAPHSSGLLLVLIGLAVGLVVLASVVIALVQRRRPTPPRGGTAQEAVPAATSV